MKATILKSFVVAGLVFFSAFAFSTEYIYRDVVGNSLPNPKCVDQQTASNRAADQYYVHRAAKTFCEVQGYGWHLAEQTQDGKLVCNECGSGSGSSTYQCYLQDIQVKCQRIKPGSVGMFPGKG